MSYGANEAYLEAQVMSASPLELVKILYGAAAAAVRDARRHLASGDVLARSREISRAMNIMAELGGALDRNAGGEFAGRLAELYGYIGVRLMDAHVRQRDEPLAEVLALLTTLRQGWDGLERPAETPRLPLAASAGEAGAASHSWTA
ncbi:MAG: flagellar export chaperone FliS [Bryobacteraceae bacterium]